MLEMADLQEGLKDSQTNLNSEIRMLNILNREGSNDLQESVSLKRGIDQVDSSASTSSKR